jgi:hypothetical protein
MLRHVVPQHCKLTLKFIYPGIRRQPGEYNEAPQDRIIKYIDIYDSTILCKIFRAVRRPTVTDNICKALRTKSAQKMVLSYRQDC